MAEGSHDCKILLEVPEARIIGTGNAFSNDLMLAINGHGVPRLRYKTIWELSVEEVLARPRRGVGTIRSK